MFTLINGLKNAVPKYKIFGTSQIRNYIPPDKVAQNRLFIKDGINSDNWRLVYGVNNTKVLIGTYGIYAYLTFLASAIIQLRKSVDKTNKEILRDLANQSLLDQILLGVSFLGFGALFLRRRNRLIRLYKHKIEPRTYSLIWYNWLLTPKKIQFKSQNVKWIDSKSLFLNHLFGNMVVGDRQFIVDDRLFPNRMDYLEMRNDEIVKR